MLHPEQGPSTHAHYWGKCACATPTADSLTCCGGTHDVLRSNDMWPYCIISPKATSTSNQDASQSAKICSRNFSKGTFFQAHPKRKKKGT